MRISDWSSDVCSSDLVVRSVLFTLRDVGLVGVGRAAKLTRLEAGVVVVRLECIPRNERPDRHACAKQDPTAHCRAEQPRDYLCPHARLLQGVSARSEEHTSELQSLMRISYAVLRLKKKT